MISHKYGYPLVIIIAIIITAICFLLISNNKNENIEEYKKNIENFILRSIGGISHTIKIEGRPDLDPQVIPIRRLEDIIKENSELKVCEENVALHILFARRERTPFSDTTIGNGVMLSSTAILTARHVAEYINDSKDPRPEDGALLCPLEGG